MKARITVERSGSLLCTYVGFSGSVVGSGQRELASVVYRDEPGGASLRICMGADTLELASTSRHLSGNAGCMLLNGQPFGSYDFRNLLQPLTLLDCDGRLLMQVHEDDLQRRFLWAYRLGATRQEARAYAHAGYGLLVGGGFALASLVRPLNKPLHYRDSAVFSIMNDADERVFHTRSRAEQLCTLACACWWLCDAMHPAKSHHVEAVLPADVPSTAVRNNRVTLLPQHLEPRNRRVELMASHPVYMWLWVVCAILLSLVILPLSQGAFLAEHVGVLVYTSLIPGVWILFCRISRQRGAQRLARLDEQMQSAASCDM
jgi:hypothetical protein